MQPQHYLRGLLRPVYGEKVHVRPKHWWNPKQRKAARLAARLMDYQYETLQAEMRERMVRLLVDSSWTPIGSPPSEATKTA